MSIILLAVFTIVTCQFDFATLVMATTPIQLYLYLMLIACVVKVRNRYPIEERKKMGLTVMPGGRLGLLLLGVCVFFICMFAIYANGADYFITGFTVLFVGLVAYILCKWIYKGRALEDPKIYPLNPKTKLGLGDLFHIGVYIFLRGAIALIGSIVLYFYEGSYGVTYYLEKYQIGLFSDFYGMLNICKWMGLLLIAVGIVIIFVGRKTEGVSLSRLKERRKNKLDERILELHGSVPRKTSKEISMENGSTGILCD